MAAKFGCLVEAEAELSHMEIYNKEVLLSV